MSIAGTRDVLSNKTYVSKLLIYSFTNSSLVLRYNGKYFLIPDVKIELFPALLVSVCEGYVSLT